MTNKDAQYSLPTHMSIDCGDDKSHSWFVLLGAVVRIIYSREHYTPQWVNMCHKGSPLEVTPHANFFPNGDFIFNMCLNNIPFSKKSPRTNDLETGAKVNTPQLKVIYRKLAFHSWPSVIILNSA